MNPRWLSCTNLEQESRKSSLDKRVLFHALILHSLGWLGLQQLPKKAVGRYNPSHRCPHIGVRVICIHVTYFLFQMELNHTDPK